MASTRKTKTAPAVKQPSKLSGPQQVVEFMDKLDHPLKAGMQALRKIILGADEGITEHIKWNAPSFCFNGEDRVTFNVHRGECILIVFHKGAKTKERKGSGPFLEDTTGLLEWLSDDRAIVKLHSAQEVRAKKAKLEQVVRKWIAATS
jgi:hypothetical protein